MTLRLRIATLPLVVLLAACAPRDAAPGSAAVVRLPSPAEAGSLAPRLSGGAGRPIILSWIERGEQESARLRFSRLREDGWAPAQTIAEAGDWFVNWADTPSVTPLRGGGMFAHWLQRTGDEPYAYGVRISHSADSGATWSAPVVPHADASAAEHGFVSVVPDDAGGADVVWLDGRAMAMDHEHGSTALMHARLGPDGTAGPESILDDMVCDCCSTSAVRLDDGTLVAAYRDRDRDEHRDISVVRLAPGQEPARGKLAADGWLIAGCPVNGPSLATDGIRVALAWFTRGRDDRPRVMASVSTDGGATFNAPNELSGGAGGIDPTGRVATVASGDGTFAVGYVADIGEQTYFLVRFLSADAEPSETVLRVAGTSRVRSSGFPVLAAEPGGLVAAWTVPGEPTRVSTARIDLAGVHASAAPRLLERSAPVRAASILSRPDRFAR